MAAAVVAVLALSPALAADELPAPSLQLSRQLTLPAPDQPVDETERALLRVEWKAARSGADETVAVDDMLLRLQRLGHSVAQLRSQLVAAPPAPPSTAEPAAPAVATAGFGYWLPALAGIAALSLFLIARRRRPPTPLMEDTTFQPLNATQTAVLPGTPITGPAQTLAPPTIDSGQAGGDGRPPLAHDQPPTPPSDEQIPLELADVLVSMGLADGAVKTLEEYIRQHPRRALCHWLKLLEVYRRFGMQAEFEAAAHELNQQFNVAPADWQPAPAGAPAFSIESYPHIRARLVNQWRRRGCADYLTQLLADNRGGTRTGFPQTVAEEILFLQGILRS